MLTTHRARIITLFLIAGTFCAVGAQAATTVYWLRDGSGIYPDVTPPTEFNDGKKDTVVWKAVVGKSYSSPIIANGTVFITSEPYDTVAVDFASGKVLWKTSTAVTDLPKDQQGQVVESPHESGSAAATPAFCDDIVYSTFGNGMVVAYEAKTGKRVWTQAINAAPNSMEGRSASPIVVDDLLIVHLTDLCGLELKTGKVRWRTDKATDAYGTPTVCTIGADKVIVTPKGAFVKASDGKLVGQVDATMGFGGPIVVKNKACFVDSTVVIFEMPEKLTDAPFTKLKEYWVESIEGQTYSTPLFVDGLLYSVTADGKMTIFNLEKKTKTEKVFELSSDTYPSPQLAGKNIFIGNDKGKYIVLEPGADPKIVATNELSEGGADAPAFSGKSIVLRVGDTLYRFEKK